MTEENGNYVIKTVWLPGYFVKQVLLVQTVGGFEDKKGLSEANCLFVEL